MNIVLCGFMGCGKTTVGKALAQLLDFAFVDMDAYIEEKAGLQVSDIFAREGEPAFRRMEAEACRELSRESGLVIATGGGPLLAGAGTAADKEKRIRELMEKRLPTYRQAASLAVDGNRPARQVAAEIRSACKFYIDK